MKAQKSFFDKEHSRESYAKYKPENWRIGYLRRVLKALDINSDDIFLDIGCGGLGYIIQEVAKRKRCYSIGVDISSVGIRQASSFAKKNLNTHCTCEFIVCSATHLPFIDGSFSKITLIMVLEHIPNEQAVISEISRICKNKGRVLISVPNSYRRSLPILTLAKMKADKAVGHLRSYKAENLLKNLRRMGFVLQQLEYHAHFIKLMQYLLQHFPLTAGDKVWWMLEDFDARMYKVPTGSAFTVILVKQ